MRAELRPERRRPILFRAQPITAHQTTSFLWCLVHQKRTRRIPDQTSPSPSYATLHRRLRPKSKPRATFPTRTPPPPAPCWLPRCCRTPVTTSALRRRSHRHERRSPPPSPHPPRPSPPLIRWARAQAPAVICPPPRPSTPRAGTGAPCRGWSLPRATWPPPPRRRVIKVTTTNKATPVSCRYLNQRH
jgi:hypothetical protein